MNNTNQNPVHSNMFEKKKAGQLVNSPNPPEYLNNLALNAASNKIKNKFQNTLQFKNPCSGISSFE
jgi:hypothetical protein